MYLIFPTEILSSRNTNNLVERCGYPWLFYINYLDYNYASRGLLDPISCLLTFVVAKSKVISLVRKCYDAHVFMHVLLHTCIHTHVHTCTRAHSTHLHIHARAPVHAHKCLCN